MTGGLRLLRVQLDLLGTGTGMWYSEYMRLLLSIDTAVFLWTRPINFDRVFSSMSEHGFSFGYPPLAISVRLFLVCFEITQRNAALYTQNTVVLL